MTGDSYREKSENTQQVVSNETPSTENAAGVYPTDGDQRQAILDNIPLRDGVDPEDLLRELAESAEFARIIRKEQKIMPSMSRLRNEMERLKKDYEALGKYAKRELRRFLQKDLDEAIDEVLSLDNRPDHMRDRGGKKRNIEAHTFVLHCASYWLDYSGRRPPKSCGTDSPFYKFAMAALPQDVLPSRYYSDLTEIVNQALRQFYGSHPFAASNRP